MLTGNDLGVIGIIGIILLIGIVKKNAIMMIDFALDAEREQGMSPRDAIHQAALLRFRPILMTTMAALFAAVPLMLGFGHGRGAAPPAGHRHLRRPDRQPAPDHLHDAGGLLWPSTGWRPPSAGPARPRAERPPRPRRSRPNEPLRPPSSRRPIATILLTIGLALAGVAGFFVLPVAPLPMVDFPAVSVSGAACRAPARRPWPPAWPRRWSGGWASSPASTRSPRTARPARRAISLQFDLSKNVDAAAREVQAAINAARADLPSTLRSNPTYRKANPAAQPVIILALTSDTKTPGQIYDAVNNIVQQRLSPGDRRRRRGDRRRLAAGGAGGDLALRAQPLRRQPGGRARRHPVGQRQPAQGHGARTRAAGGSRSTPRPAASKAADYRAADHRLPQRRRRSGSADVAEVIDSVQDTRTIGLFNGKPAIVVLVTQQPNANVIATVNEVRADPAAAGRPAARAT